MVEKIKKAKQKLRSPSAFTILFVVIIIMAALTWVVPSGLYMTNEDGDRIANSYHVVDKERTVTEEKDMSLIHTSEPPQHLSISYAVFCLQKKKPLTHTQR